MWLQQKVGKVHRRGGTVWRYVQKVKYVGKCSEAKQGILKWVNLFPSPYYPSGKIIRTRIKKCALTVTTLEFIYITRKSVLGEANVIVLQC